MTKQQILLVCGLFLVLTACASHTRERSLERTLDEYAVVLRWGDFTMAQQFLDPEAEDSHPSDFELSRLAQFKVSSYRDRGTQIIENEDETVTATQFADIRFYNRHNLAERQYVDRQSWRWDEEDERWYLTSGLPELPSGR